MSAWRQGAHRHDDFVGALQKLCFNVNFTNVIKKLSHYKIGHGFAILIPPVDPHCSSWLKKIPVMLFKNYKFIIFLQVMLYLMELPIKDDLHVHLARLTGVLDKIGDISKLNKKQVNNNTILQVQ